MYQGLVQGLQQNLHQGLGSKWAVAAIGPTLLADLDFRTPVTTSDFSSPSGYETQYWDFQTQTVAGKYDNGVGSATLDNSGGLTDQTAMGVFNGTDYESYNAWEADTTTDKCTASSGAVCQPVNTDFAVRAVVRYYGLAANAHTICGNYTTNGWVLYTSGGNIYFSLKDSTLKSVQLTASDALLKGGGVHVLTAWYDHSAEMAYMKLDNGTPASVATAAGEGDFSSAAFAIGDGLSSAEVGMQTLFIGYCEGANAQAYYDETVTLPGTDPTGLLTTTSRASLISVPVSATAVAHFAPNTLPIGYHSALAAGAGGYGLYCNSAVQNLIPESENMGLSPWSITLATRAQNAASSPDGFYSANKITQTGADGRYYATITGLTASTEYTFSFWARTDDGGHDVAVKMTNHANSAYIETTTRTIADAWDVYSVTFTTEAGQTQSQMNLSGGLSTDTDKVLYAWGIQLNKGSARGAYIRTSGAAATLTAQVLTVDFAAGTLYKAAAGELEAVYVTSAVGSAAHRFIADASQSPYGNTNRHYHYIAANASVTNANHVIYDSSAVLAANVAAASPPSTSIESTAVSRWNETGGLAAGGGEDATISVNGAGVGSDVGTYTSTDTITRIRVGSSNTGAGQPDGFISRIRVWDGER